MWFFSSPYCGATGFLEERLKNQRKAINSKRTVLEYKLDEAVLQSWDSENENGNNFTTLSYVSTAFSEFFNSR